MSCCASRRVGLDARRRRSAARRAGCAGSAPRSSAAARAGSSPRPLRGLHVGPAPRDQLACLAVSVGGQPQTSATAPSGTNGPSRSFASRCCSREVARSGSSTPPPVGDLRSLGRRMRSSELDRDVAIAPLAEGVGQRLDLLQRRAAALARKALARRPPAAARSRRVATRMSCSTLDVVRRRARRRVPEHLVRPAPRSRCAAASANGSSQSSPGTSRQRHGPCIDGWSQTYAPRQATRRLVGARSRRRCR